MIKETVKLIILITFFITSFGTIKTWGWELKDEDIGGKGEKIMEAMRFEYPEIKDPETKKRYRLNWCYFNAEPESCGMTAADAFCRKFDYGGAVNWKEDKDIGRFHHTWMMGAEEVCRQKFCSGFIFIDCSD